MNLTDSTTWWNGLSTLTKDNLGKKYFPLFNYSDLSDWNIETICIAELREQNRKLKEALKKILATNSSASVDQLISTIKLIAFAAIY